MMDAIAATIGHAVTVCLLIIFTTSLEVALSKPARLNAVHSSAYLNASVDQLHDEQDAIHHRTFESSMRRGLREAALHYRRPLHNPSLTTRERRWPTEREKNIHVYTDFQFNAFFKRGWRDVILLINQSAYDLRAIMIAV